MHKRFGGNIESFKNDTAYQLSCCMCILQIGEIVGNLSDDARTEIKNVDWRGIKGIRNIFAHNYGSMDIDKTWSILSIEVPDLQKKCSAVISHDVFKEVTPEQLVEIKNAGIHIDSKTFKGKTIIKYNADDEAAVTSIIDKVRATQNNQNNSTRK